MMVIYQAKNKVNGKCYIGRTTESLNRRIYRHLHEAHKPSGSPFKRAIQKYGMQSFEWSIIDTADSTEILAEKEIYWISYFNTKAPNGYNLTEGGDGSYGCRPSEETRKKMSDSGKGKHDKILSEETKKKMSLSMLTRNNPAKRPEVREKLRSAWRARKAAKESAEKEIRDLLLHFSAATNTASIPQDGEKEETLCQTN